MRKLKNSTKILSVLIPILILLFIGACTNPIIIRNLKHQQDGHFMFGAVPERNFYYTLEIGDSLTEMWRNDMHGSFPHSSIIAYSDYIFAPDLSGRIYGYNIKNGEGIGVMNEEDGEVEVAPVMHKFILTYVRNNYKSKYSTLYFYNIYLNSYANKVEIEGGVNNELLIVDNSLYILTDKGKLYKFNFNGSKIWEYETETNVNCNPAYYNGNIIFGNSKGELISISESGELNYKQKYESDINGGITIKNGKTYFGTYSGKLFCSDAETGNELWEYNTGSRIVVHPVLDDNNVFISNLAGKIVSLQKDSGNLIWSKQTDGVYNSTAVCFDDNLIQPDFDENVRIIDKSTGNLVNTLKYDKRVKLNPVYFNDILFIGVDDGEIIAYESILKKSENE
jgi:outer membrane protein assembly factor BamB